MPKKPLIFVGSRDKQALLHIVAEARGYEILGILDYHYYGNTDKIDCVPVIGDERSLLDPTDKEAQRWLKTCDFFVANWWYGNQHINQSGPDLQRLRLDRIGIVEQTGANVINLIHPNSETLGGNSKYATLKIGKGVFIDDNCWVCPHNVSIGNYCQIMQGSKFGAGAHLRFNVCVGPFTHIHHVDIGDNSYIGIYSKINLIHTQDHMLNIGNNVTTWTNSQILKDIPSNSIHTDKGRIFKKHAGALI